MQEQEHDQHREQRAFDDRFLDAGNAALHLIRLRVDEPDLDVLRQARLQRFQRRAEAAAGLDDIGILRLADIDRDRGPAVDPRDRVELLLAVDHICDLAQIHRSAALLRNDDAAELRGVLDLSLYAHDRVTLTPRDAAGRDVLVGVLHRGHNLIDADAERRQRGGSYLDEYLPCHAPVDDDLRDAGDVLDRLDDRLIGERGELAQLDRRREHRERHRGSVVLDLDPDHLRILDVAREIRPHQRDLVAGILDRAGDVGAEAELDEHLASPLTRVRIDPLDTRNGVDGVFDGLAHVGLDDLGRGARINGFDIDERQRHIRHLLDAQPRVREHPEHHDPDHDHGGENRVVDRDTSDPHQPVLL